MRRLVLLGTVLGGLAIAAAACSEVPVQPTPNAVAIDDGGVSGKTSTTVSCENLIYPYTLCSADYRPALCVALNNGGTITKIPYGSRWVDATFVRTSDPVGAQETAKTYYTNPSYPTSTMTFPIVSQTQIDSPALCPRA